MDTFESIIESTLGDAEYLVGGAKGWGALQLGQTEMWPATLWVYNAKVSRVVPGRSYYKVFFIKQRFPRAPRREYWAVDMLNHNSFMASMGRHEIMASVDRFCSDGKLSYSVFLWMVCLYGTEETQKYVASFNVLMYLILWFFIFVGRLLRLESPPQQVRAMVKP